MKTASLCLGGLGERRERGGVAVHAEEGLGDEQPAARRPRLVEEACGTVRVSVGIDGYSRPGEAAAIDDAGMVEGVGDDDVLGSGQCGQDAEVGLIARGEDECSLAAEKPGQRLLEQAVRGEVAGDQAGGGGTEAVAGGGGGGGGGQGRVLGQAEIVIRAEGESRLPRDRHARSR